MEDNFKITIIKDSTKQIMELNSDDSKEGALAILYALKVDCSTKSLGLLASDLKIKLTKGEESNIYYTYDRGYILTDKNKESFCFFEYGNKWYEMFQKELNEILTKYPDYFMNIEIK